MPDPTAISPGQYTTQVRPSPPLAKEKIKHEAPDRASIWTDTNVYNELGNPAIKIGPRGRRIGPRNEEIEIDVMVNAAKLYALIALDICTRARS